jgi:glutamate synthase domain-containing protein 2
MVTGWRGRMDLMEWLRQSWGYLVLAILFIGALFKAIQATFASERDRQALKNANLEREKLDLEVNRLRNSPEAVKDRREVYDKLRQQVQAITTRRTADISQIKALQQLKHDATYRFPHEVVEAIEEVIQSAGVICWSAHSLQPRQQMENYEKWEEVIKTNSDANLDIVRFETTMVDLFKPYLRL